MSRSQIAKNITRATEADSALGVRDVIHELRNSLTPVVSFAQAMRLLDLPEEAREYTELVAHAAARTVRVTRGLEQLTSSDGITRSLCDLNELLHAIAEDLRPRCQASNIQFEIDTDDNCPPVSIEPERFRDALFHLLDVAIDACSLVEAGKTSTVKLTNAHRNGTVLITIGFDGMRIPEATLRTFLKGNDKIIPKGGTGLALHLARTGVRAHGGDIAFTQQKSWKELTVRLYVGNKKSGEVGFGGGGGGLVLVRPTDTDSTQRDPDSEDLAPIPTVDGNPGLDTKRGLLEDKSAGVGAMIIPLFGSRKVTTRPLALAA